MDDRGVGVTVVGDLVYDTRGGVRLLADLYLPPRAAGGVPVIVWVHGGGWRYGSRHAAPDLRRFFAVGGFAMVAVEYRSTDRATFPAQVEDLRTAIRWVRSVAATYGLDADRIGLWGASAGGHLASVAALCPVGMFEPSGRAWADRSSHVQAVVTGYAPIDFLRLDDDRPPPESVVEDPENLALPAGMRSADPDSFESLLLGAPIASCPARVAEASPITYARPDAPPFLIVHGSSDTTVGARQSERLYGALARHENDVVFYLIDGLGHGFLNRSNLDDAPDRRMTRRTHRRGEELVECVRQPVFPTIEAFFRKHLGAGAQDTLC